MQKRWILPPVDTLTAQRLARELNVHPVVASLLAIRGVTNAEAGKNFLDRRLSGLHDPETLPGACQAADILHQAILARKSICIYGDYDVDGMCATAILLRLLRLAGANPRFYVPDRLEEGYGVNEESLVRLREEGVELIVTVDCGITSAVPAERARSLGLTYIVTDHHEYSGALPQADAIVHPRLPGSAYPFGELCGAGVAFKLAWEVARRLSGARKTSETFQKFLLDATSLAAIGTVCDVTPLLDENRALVHHGLISLKKSPTPGLAALMEITGIDKKEALDADDIGFTLGPRLNACGRLGQARLGVELLVTTDAKRAAELAKYLDDENRVRQTIERRIYNDAKKQASEMLVQEGADERDPLVLASKDWHSGVIGIVASRLVEKFHRPTVLIALNDDVGAGSGRSLPGFHLQKALHECGEFLEKSGGHAMAAGLKIRADRIDAFRAKLAAVAREQVPDAFAEPTLHVDLEVPLHVLTHGLIRWLDLLAPFGQANPAPLLLATNLTVVGDPKGVGASERHLSFRVRQGEKIFRAIAFGQAERKEDLLSQQGKCCLIFSPSINVYQGRTEISLRVRDFRPGAQVAGAGSPVLSATA